MQIKVKGEMSIPALRQAIFEALADIEEQHGVRYSLDATLYITPSNGFGDEVSPRYPNGQVITKLYAKGPYVSAASRYNL